MPQCLTALTIRVGMDQIIKTFSFGEIELAVLERTARELPGSAGRKPSMAPSASNIAAITARPPWT
jgi:pyrimidine operon attenuation protein/uracil phosphoribosyltransferase